MTKTFCGITKKRDAFLHPIFINLNLFIPKNTMTRKIWSKSFSASSLRAFITNLNHYKVVPKWFVPIFSFKQKYITGVWEQVGSTKSSVKIYFLTHASCTEAYLKHWQLYRMELFAKIVNSFQPLFSQNTPH